MKRQTAHKQPGVCDFMSLTLQDCFFFLSCQLRHFANHQQECAHTMQIVFNAHTLNIMRIGSLVNAAAVVGYCADRPR